MEGADVRPHFFNENEDSNTAKPKWSIEVGEAEVPVSDQFNFEESGKRVIFQGQGGIWALRFPSNAAYQEFYRQYNDKLFENTYMVQSDDANRQKVYSPSIHTHPKILSSLDPNQLALLQGRCAFQSYENSKGVRKGQCNLLPL